MRTDDSMDVNRVTAAAKPLPPALADSPDVRGGVSDGSRPDDHA